MKKLSKALFACALVAFMASSAAAVTLSTDNTGDYLIFPAYVADGPLETALKVVNTSNTDSVVAKVVFRGATHSLELRDFFIYLSPNDVWTGKVYYKNGKSYVYSDDDSVATAWDPDTQTVTWGDESPLDIELVDQNCEYEQYGYIEVFEAYNAPLTKSADGTVDKDDIYVEYEGVTTNDVASRISANSLYGAYEINLPIPGLKGSGNAVTFEDVFINTVLGFGETSFVDALATVDEVEQLLSKAQVFAPYYRTPEVEGITAHFFTFPTKRIAPNTDCVTNTRDPNATGSFWYDNALVDDFDVPYGLTYYDLKENSPGKDQTLFSPIKPGETSKFDDELNVNTSYEIDEAYEEGWVRYEFEDFATAYAGADGSLTGAPVIPVVLNFGPKGISIYDAAYEFGTLIPTPVE